MNEPPFKIVFVISLDCLSNREHHFPARLLQWAGQCGGLSSELPLRLHCKDSDHLVLCVYKQLRMSASVNPKGSQSIFSSVRV